MKLRIKNTVTKAIITTSAISQIFARKVFISFNNLNQRNERSGSKWLNIADFTILPDDLKCQTKISLSLYLVPGASPLEYVSRFIGFDSTCDEIKKNRVKFKNTLIGHIGFST